MTAMREEARLAHRLAALPEPAMREAVLVELLGAMPPAEAVHALAELQDGATRMRTPAYLVSVGAIAGALERVPYAVRRDIYEAAKSANLEEVARLFLSWPRGVERSGAPPVDEPPPPEPEQYVAGAGRTLTLGERKALARGGRRDLLAALLRDPDASVIANLLENPRLTEKDVLAVASRRPVRGDVLRALFASKWVARYHVKRALVLNPYTPGDLAVRLVGTLFATDLRLVAADAQLAEPVRAQARGLLRSEGA